VGGLLNYPPTAQLPYLPPMPAPSDQALVCIALHLIMDLHNPSKPIRTCTNYSSRLQSSGVRFSDSRKVIQVARLGNNWRPTQQKCKT